MNKLLESKRIKPKKGVVNKCLNCSKEFYVQQSLKHRKYCSQKCSYKHRNEIQRTNKPLECTVCGSEFYCSKSQQKHRNRQTCSNKCKYKLFELRGEDRRKSGVSKRSLDRGVRYSAKMERWRKAVFERDNWTCQDCGARSGKGNPVILNADHIKPFAYFEDLRFDIDNGRTLCVNCHKETDTFGRGAIKKHGKETKAQHSKT